MNNQAKANAADPCLGKIARWGQVCTLVTAHQRTYRLNVTFKSSTFDDMPSRGNNDKPNRPNKIEPSLSFVLKIIFTIS